MKAALACLFLVGIASNAAATVTDDRAHWKTATLDLDNFVLDKAYPAMFGPTHTAFLSPQLKPTTKRIWIKALSVEIFNEAGAQEPMTFLCHAWLRPKGPKVPLGDGMLTISEGMGYSEFPKGYGLPVPRDTPIAAVAQALNDGPELTQKLRYRFKVSYLEDRSANGDTLIPLRHKAVRTFGPPARTETGALCEGAPVLKDGTSEHFEVPPGTHTFFGHYRPGYFVRPGTIHFIKVHLHRYGKTVAFLDRTSGKVLWTGKTSYNAKGQISGTESYSSRKGIPVFPDHEYEMTSVYDNPSDKNATGMAVLRLYLSYP